MQLLEEQARKIAEEAKEDQPLQTKKSMTFVKLVEVIAKTVSATHLEIW